MDKRGMLVLTVRYNSGEKEKLRGWTATSAAINKLWLGRLDHKALLPGVRDARAAYDHLSKMQFEYVVDPTYTRRITNRWITKVSDTEKVFYQKKPTKGIELKMALQNVVSTCQSIMQRMNYKISEEETFYDAIDEEEISVVKKEEPKDELMKYLTNPIHFVNKTEVHTVYPLFSPRESGAAIPPPLNSYLVDEIEHNISPTMVAALVMHDAGEEVDDFIKSEIIRNRRTIGLPVELNEVVLSKCISDLKEKDHWPVSVVSKRRTLKDIREISRLYDYDVKQVISRVYGSDYFDYMVSEEDAVLKAQKVNREMEMIDMQRKLLTLEKHNPSSLNTKRETEINRKESIIRGREIMEPRRVETRHGDFVKTTWVQPDGTKSKTRDPRVKHFF